MVTGALRWTALAAVAAVTLAGCGGGGESHVHTTPLSAASDPAGHPAQPAGAITQDRLRDALLQSYPGLTAITAAQNGAYSTLPAAQIAAATESRPAGATVTPAKCGSALWSGPGVKAYGSAPGTVVAYRKPGDSSPGGLQVWEELIASSGPQPALGADLPGGCGKVRIKHDGDTLTVEDQRPPKLGTGSRGVRLSPSSKSSRRTWLTTFTGPGYIGVVFMQGPVTKAQIDAFASAAYKNAHAKLG